MPDSRESGIFRSGWRHVPNSCDFSRSENSTVDKLDEPVEPSCNLQVIKRTVMQFARSYRFVLLLTYCFNRFFISISIGMKAAP